MAAEPLELEELIDRATNPDNTSSNATQALAVCDQVNREFNGPQNAIKLLIHKLHLHQEIISLQVLNVIEACVQNCGKKFHTEIGKYKFLNELIKLLSPKYDGDITPQAIKDRVTVLLFSWYVGLPDEKKIGEAYKMLKQQGVIKKDPVDPKRTSEPLPQRPQEDTVFTEEGNSELLATLLASKDPEDLAAANKLIKSMVKQEEERLERVSKRIQELETVGNNTKLLNDMIMQYGPNTPDSDKDVMNQLYQSCINMRPELFKLASKSADDKDDAINDILQASDELTKVIDDYKEIVLLQTRPPPAPQQDEAIEDSSNTELLDLGFDAPEPTSNAATTSSTSDNWLLDDQFAGLGLDATVPEPTSQTDGGLLSNDFASFSQPSVQPSSMPVPQQMYNPFPTPYPMQNMNNFGMMNPPQPLLSQQQQQQAQQPQTQTFSTSAAPSSMGQSGIGPIRPQQNGLTPSSSAAQSVSNTAKTNTNKAEPSKPKDLLDFDVFSEFRSPTISKSSATPKPIPAVKDTSPVSSLLDLSEPITNRAPVAATPVIPPSISSTPPVEQSQPALQPVSPAAPQPVSQESYFVPLEAIKAGSYPPMIIMDKDGLKTILNIAQDTRDVANKNVLVTVLSTISTNIAAIGDFNVSVAVPKSMRVKLQPATSTNLPAYNPILPPSSITQIMLIANPRKEKIKLRFRINYSIDGVVRTDNATLDDFPVT